MKSILLLIFLLACAPRGDHKSVETVFKDHEERLKKVIVHSPKEVRPTIDSLLELSEKNYEIVNSTDLLTISNHLDVLTLRAGYTSRAALYELSTNFRNFAKIEKVNPVAVRLSLARMMSLLATELKTTKFNVI